MDPRLEYVTANFAGRARRALLGGRPHLVAPVVMLVPGVLAGSDGPGYYPPAPTAESAHRWNGLPLTNGHPTAPDGAPVSARSPGAAERYGLGTVYAASFDGVLRAEAWFDEAAVRNKAPALAARIEAGLPVEVSTGLRLRRDPAPAGATHNGRPYDWVAADYDPDHLAILADVPGACAIGDGCGLNVNAAVSGDAPAPTDTSKPRSAEAGMRAGRTDSDRRGASVGWRTLARAVANAMGLRKSKPGPKPADSDDPAPKGDPKPAKAMRCPGCGTGVSTAEIDGGKCKSCGKALAPPKPKKPAAPAPDAKTKPDDPTANANSPGDDMNPDQRKAAVAWLTANCACFKDPAAAKGLDALPDAAVADLKTNAEYAAAAKAAGALTANAAGDAIKEAAEARKKAADAASAPAVPAPIPVANATVPAPVPAPVIPSYDVWKAAAPAEVRAILNAAEEVMVREKAEIVGKLTAGIADGGAKAAAAAVYNAMSPAQLRPLLAAVPKAGPTANRADDPFGFLPPVYPAAGDFAGGMPAASGANDADDGPLGLPVWNWSALAAEHRAKGGVPADMN